MNNNHYISYYNKSRTGEFPYKTPISSVKGIVTEHYLRVFHKTIDSIDPTDYYHFDETNDQSGKAVICMKKYINEYNE
jgi:hypothetical protein